MEDRLVVNHYTQTLYDIMSCYVELYNIVTNIVLWPFFVILSHNSFDLVVKINREFCIP